METVRNSLELCLTNGNGSIDETIASFVRAISNDWKEDSSQLAESVNDVIIPLLEECGCSSDSINALRQATKESFQSTSQNKDFFSDAIVPIENPVQMNLSRLSKMMMASQKAVRIDWLSSKRVVASQVDKKQLHRVVSRHRQRAEKRGLKVSVGGEMFLLSSSSDAASQSATGVPMVGSAKITQLDAKSIVDDMIQDQANSSANQHGQSRDLLLQDFDVAISGKRILTDASVTIVHGRRYGLVGRNGVGKSTFLRHISARMLAGIPSRLSILHVEQEVLGDDTPAIQSVLQADFRRQALLDEERRVVTELESAGTGISCANSIDGKETDAASRELLLRLQRIHELMELHDTSKAEAEAALILAGLGFSPSAQQRATKTFSGGWRMRIALARALFCRPDLLLLDEPTNMLDFPSVVWLQNYLCDWTGTLMVVSHDRCFLDNVATDILHIHNEQIESYRGDYGTFVNTRDERLKNQQKEYENQMQYRQHLQAFVDRWRYNAAKAAQAQSRLKILERLPDLRPVVIEAPVQLRFPSIEDVISPPILELHDVSFRYNAESSFIVEKVDFNVQPRARMAIVGPNGAGKSTVLKLLAGSLEPTTGQLHRHGRLRISLFTQHHVDQLDMSLSSLETLQQRFPNKDVEEYRHVLGGFGLTGPLALQTISTLSGGQKSRLVFTLLAMEHPHVMILDEPTNHLDMDTIDALIAALKEYTGGVLVVSHDKRFVEQLCNEIWVCDHNRLLPFSGSIHEYAESLLSSNENRTV